MINKEKLRKIGRELVGAGKEAVTMTAPIYIGTAIYHTGGNPELARAVYLGTVPWMAGYTGYHYIKGRRKK